MDSRQEGGVNCGKDYGGWDEPLDIFDVVAEVGRVVDFILEELLLVRSAYAPQPERRELGLHLRSQ